MRFEKTPPIRLVLLALFALVLGTSCGTIRFNRAWNLMETNESADGFGGRWKGTWKSDFNGHSGGLRCMVAEAEGGQFVAWFHSTFAGFLTFQYKTLFTVTEENGRFHFQGEQDLGRLVGGVYRYEGIVEGDCFRASFRAENDDHGVFEMQRVRREPSPDDGGKGPCAEPSPSDP